MDGDAVRGQVVSSPHILRQLQHAHEHRRHPLALGHPVAFDQAQGLLGVEFLRHHHAAAEGLDVEDVVQRGGVIERRRRQVDGRRVDAIAVQFLAQVEAFAGADLEQRPDDALGPAGGAGAVEHRAAHPLPLKRRRWIGRQRVLIGFETIRRLVGHQPDRAVRDQRQERRRPLALIPGRHQRLGHAIVREIGRLIRRQIAVDGRDLQARAVRRPDRIHEAQVVLHVDSDVVAAPQAPVVQQVRQPVRARVLLRETDLTPPRDDHRRLVRRQARMIGEIHSRVFLEIVRSRSCRRPAAMMTGPSGLATRPEPGIQGPRRLSSDGRAAVL